MSVVAIDGRQELAPPCSATLALRRITSLLAGARRADAQGEYPQARELYTEILKVQRSLARAPLGSIGKSLRDVAAGVEARLQHLRVEGREGDSTTCSSSRPTTNNSAPSSSSKCSSAARPNSQGNRGSHTGLDDLMPFSPSGQWSSRIGPQISPEVPCGYTTNAWDTSTIPESPAMARDGCNGRPTTRDGGTRPCSTQDSGINRRPSKVEDRRPNTQDRGLDSMRHDSADLRHAQQQATLDGTRPSTRDGARLQQMIEGGASRRIPTAERTNSAGGQRPQTRDGVRLPTRPGTSERRGQDVSIRQVTTSRRHRRAHQQQQAPEVLNLEHPLTTNPEDRAESLSTCADDESVELLE